MKVRWSDRSGQDVLAIGEFIALSDRSAAIGVADRIKGAGDNLETFPRRGRPGRLADTRELVVTGLSYILIYRVFDEDVEILRVLHGAQDWPRPASD